MTKTFTAICLLGLVDEGKVKLTDPITEYIPEFDVRIPADWTKSKQEILSKMTVGSLLQHRSGLPMNVIAGMWGDTSQDMEDIVQHISSEFLLYYPDSVTSFSNLGYSLAGIILQRNGKHANYTEFVQQEILNPLGMNDTDFNYENHMNLFGGLHTFAKPNDRRMSIMRDLATAGLYSTVKDMSHLLSFILKKDNKIAKKMMSGKDLGLMKLNNFVKNSNLYWNSSKTPNHHSFMAVLPDYKYRNLHHGKCHRQSS